MDTSPTCTGCDKVIDEGSVIAFGDSLFHLKCFICAKCSEPVDCESNLLLLTNGKPVCENCSYCCNACKLVIHDEAIMTGDQAYHADCFKCVSCKNKIEDLVFTQTSKGIHCTPCHEKRRAEKQKRREEREKRLQQKQRQKDLPSTPQRHNQLQPPNNQYSRSSSRLFDSQLVTDYINRPTHSRSPSRASNQKSLTDPPTPSRSRSNSIEIPRLSPEIPQPTPSRSEAILSSSNKSSSLHSPPLSVDDNKLNKLSLDLPALNLSFFDNDSTDLINLTKKLGANISLDIYGIDKEKAAEVPVIVKTTENITRASQLLESSLTAEIDDLEEFPRPPSSNLIADRLSVYTTSLSSASSFSLQQKQMEQQQVEEQLRTEIEIANSKLMAMQASYNKIKDASRNALEEFAVAKEEFAKEVALRQKQEYNILHLKHQLHIAYQSRHMSRTELTVITREEIERVAKARVELDRTCNELKGYRNVLVQDIESLSRQKQADIDINPTIHLQEQIKALNCEIKSLHSDKDAIREETRVLESLRDEVLHEMIMLNTKNAELTEMNNDLSRRMTEREAGFMANNSFLNTPSPSLSSELTSPIVGRKSSEASIIRGQIGQPYVTATSMLYQQQQHNIQQQQQQPKMFKLKKKGNMFSKLKGKDPAATIYGNNNSNLMSGSSLSLTTPTPPANNNNDYFSTKPATSKSSADLTTQHGSHTFLATSFLRPVKCEACGEKMWGLSELRCQGCHYIAHGRCLPHVPQLCYGSQTSTSLELEEKDTVEDIKLFGFDLSQRAQHEDRAVPLIIKHCIQVVEKSGMDYEGIYRKSGGAAQMRLIHQLYENYPIGEEPSALEFDIEDEEGIHDICAVTSVLKQYFRELPNPLIPYNLYSQFIEAVSVYIGQDRQDKFFELLSQLPKVNYDTLRLLIQHLSRVQEQSHLNLMTTKNLAMVFGPTLLRDEEASRDLIDMSYKNAIVEFLILHVHDLLS
ncbi:uncharacterized protein B0P05DRAFT_520801 [Gilbertella persicaria]|uniref:uncharacterized protein n=1 Tax=Gilbertella persicaria TaxID=101096 RepID=UPI00221F8EFF|nr:uncharacterized protein B0P05DRAFT_520801 [Gilbertella persicaria]KAI8098176.1 hypothetical protein B0P05DRAFT_520801 [Gilbertella persicaria]